MKIVRWATLNKGQKNKVVENEGGYNNEAEKQDLVDFLDEDITGGAFINLDNLAIHEH